MSNKKRKFYVIKSLVNTYIGTVMRRLSEALPDLPVYDYGEGEIYLHTKRDPKLIQDVLGENYSVTEISEDEMKVGVTNIRIQREKIHHE